MRKSSGNSAPSFPESQLILGSAKYDFIRLEDLENPIVRRGADYWLSLCGARCFPTRGDVNLREISSILSHMTLIKVIEGGADFELRVVGDAIASALRVPMHNRRLSEIGSEAPMFAERNSKFYRSVVESGRPLALHSHFGLDSPELKFTNVEAVILPLGSRDDVVDHLLAFANYISRLD
jgi:hypothetical protein